jgi:hypothetical protein
VADRDRRLRKLAYAEAPHAGGVAGSVVLLGAVVAALIDGSIGLFIIFSGFAYVSRCLRDALAA